MANGKGRPPVTDEGEEQEAAPLEHVEVPAQPEPGSEAFRAAVREEVERLVKAAAAEQKAPVGQGADINQLFHTLAMSIAEVADQGTNRKRIAPEILAARKTANDEMMQLLDMAHAQGLQAEYRVRSNIYFHERLIPPFRQKGHGVIEPVEIIWSGPPNDALEPLNDVAKQIFAAYRRSVGMPEYKSDSKFTPDNRPYWVTAGGLVVKGDPPAHRFVAPEQSFADDLTIKGEADPRAPLIRILGTQHAPARQSVSGQAA